MNLDIQTLVLVVGLTTCCSALVIFIIHRLRFPVQGTLYWAWGSFVIACSLVLFGLRGTLPDLLSIVLANTAIAFGHGIIYSGIRLFVGRTSRLRIALLVSLALAGFLFWFSHVSPWFAVRAGLVALVLGGFSSAMGFELVRDAAGTGRKAERLLGYLYGCNAAYYLLRIVLAVFQAGEPLLLQSGAVTVGQFLWSLVVVFCSTAGMIMIIGERLDSEITTLRGMVPICANCKKIRDDAGAWQQVEVYVRDHSDAEFSHGICPECMKKLYPEFEKEMHKDNPELLPEK